MSNNVFELINFKDYLPLDLDITDKNRLVYRPVLAPTQLKCSLEPALTEEQLYVHMKKTLTGLSNTMGMMIFINRIVLTF